ncbi:hypothetical protein FQN54_000214 [Arachnomyces sp. PD_36]|nr:hypothetical protein FQN54_000214 [Arachnomyces sp. PD_36]
MSKQNFKKIIFGAFVVSSYTPEQQKEFWDILDAYGVDQLDTAHIYEGSEETLGKLEAAKKFKIDTKTPGFYPNALSRESILKAQKISFDRLKTDSVETYILHSPDKETPISETMDTIQELYEDGKFKTFGISNFTAQGVEELYAYASSKGYVLPEVYQGNYSAMGRHLEDDVLPVLRKHKISLSIYSPLAGGFLIKSPEYFKGDGSALAGGRFDKTQEVGAVYNSLYNKPELVEPLAEWGAIAEKAGVSKAELAFRWLGYHSALRESEGDSIVLGASRPSQLKGALDALKAGPLDEESVNRIQGFWESIKEHAPVDNYHGTKTRLGGL